MKIKNNQKQAALWLGLFLEAVIFVWIVWRLGYWKRLGY
jgi:hypothetical protein